MTEPVSDDALTEAGAEFAASGAPSERALVIACGALAREILAIFRANALAVDLRCLPALLHNRPDHIPEAVRAAVTRARADGYAQISVAYADCGTGGRLAGVCAELGVEMIAGPHCYAFFEGQDAFAAHGDEEIRAFYLTDFLARQFDAIVWRGLGLDRYPDLLETYFGHYEKVVYLAQTNDPALDAAARAAAERLGLEYERRFTGFGELGLFLAGAARRER